MVFKTRLKKGLKMARGRKAHQHKDTTKSDRNKIFLVKVLLKFAWERGCCSRLFANGDRSAGFMGRFGGSVCLNMWGR